ncbi:hypothetical protein H6F90_10970 [Trichocoleus sp. FACHB-591]|uniref:hypothetical protein n=1 Tax=Trichocoleus sp. FACHB-591 TaxID=2692872 RepID=UPI001683DE77|nr:hypothetical protein [Trichocoleus sp. FACHB-591]MBD2095676.1 hypothetical protein [Trichocoleus sp. FACHB-591]
MLSLSTHLRPISLSLALTASTLLSLLLASASRSQPQPQPTTHPFQQPEKYEWTIARETVVPLTGDRLLATLAEAESLQNSINNASSEQPVQFVVIPNIEDLLQFPTSEQPQAGYLKTNTPLSAQNNCQLSFRLRFPTNEVC